jgi:hypothetical protein
MRTVKTLNGGRPMNRTAFVREDTEPRPLLHRADGWILTVGLIPANYSSTRSLGAQCEMAGLGGVPPSPPRMWMWMWVTGDAGGTLVPTITMSTTEDKYEFAQEAMDEHLQRGDG